MIVEVDVGLSVCYDEVEAEVDAPEGEEEAWKLELVRLENGNVGMRDCQIWQ